MTAFRRILYLLIILILLVGLTTVWVVATPAGLRSALMIADRFLPDELDLGTVRGTLVGGVSLANGAWRGQTVEVTVETLALELDPLPLVRGDVRLARLRADGVVVTLSGTTDQEDEEVAEEPFSFRMPVPLEIADGRLVAVSIRGPDWQRDLSRVEIGAAARGYELDVSELTVDSKWLEFDVSGEAVLRDPYSLDASGSWTFLVEGGGAFGGRGTVEGDRRGWRVRHELRQPIALSSVGEIRFLSGDFSAGIRNDWERIEWQLPDGRQLSATDGQATVEGWFDAYRFGADSRVAVDGLPPMLVEASGDGRGLDLGVDEIHIAGDAGQLDARGRLDLKPDVRWDLAFDATGVRPALLGVPADAEFSSRGTTTGALRDEGPHAEVVIESLGGTYMGAEASATGAVTYRPDGIVLKSLDTRVGANHIFANGTIARELDLALEIRAPQLSDLWQELRGSVGGSVTVTGRPLAPRIEGSLRGESLSWENITADEALLTGSGEMATEAWLQLDATGVSIGDQSLTALRFRYAGMPDANRIELGLDLGQSTIELGAAGRLNTEGFHWEGELRRLEVTDPRLGPWQLQEAAYLALGKAEIDLGDTCLAGPRRERLCLGGAWSSEKGARLTADLDRVPLTPLQQFFPLGTEIQGFAVASAEFSWQPGSLNGEARLSIPRGLVQTRLDEEELAEIQLVSFQASAEVEDNRTRVDIGLGVGSEGIGSAWLESADILDPNAAVRGAVELSYTDLSLVSLMLPELDQVHGLLQGRLEIAGSRRDPLLDGTIRLSDGRFQFPAAGIAVTDVNVEARQNRQGQISYRGEASSGGGRARIRGTTRYVEGEGWVSELLLRGDDFQVVRLPDLEASASPDLEILIDRRRVAVGGKLVVPRADVSLRDLGSDAVQPSTDAVVHGRDGGTANVADGPTLVIDIEVTLGDEVALEGFGLQTELEGSLRLTGGSNQPWLGYGTLRLVGGRYKAYGQKLTVERGELLFSGPLDNPVLDFRAVRDAGDVVAGIQVNGTVRQPRSTLFSEPPLTEAEALSYLLTGRPLAGASSADGDLLSNAALSLGLSQAGSVAAQVRQSIGLDTFAVEGGASDGRILAGKRIGPDLYLQYAYGIFDEIGALLVRYQLTDRLELESRSGEYHSLDVIYRVERD